MMLILSPCCLFVVVVVVDTITDLMHTPRKMLCLLYKLTKARMKKINAIDSKIWLGREKCTKRSQYPSAIFG
jgi:hypothetical protein